MSTSRPAIQKKPQANVQASIRPMSAATATLQAKSLASPIEMSVPVRRIVTFHSGSLQELVFALPALRALRETFEGAPLCAVVREGLAQLLESSALVDEVLTRPEGGLSSQAGLMAKLHAHHFDMAVAFSTSRKSTLLAWSTGATVRIGFDGAKMDALFTHRVEKERSLPPTIDAFLDLTRAAGCAPRDFDYSDTLRPTPSFERDAAMLLQERGIEEPFLLCAPHSENTRPRESGAGSTPTLAQALAELSARWPVVLIGQRPNRALLRAVRDLNSGARIHDIGGDLENATLAALCGKAQLFIGLAGGACHLAAAMGTPVVTICPGEKLREVCEPRGVPHRILKLDARSADIVSATRELIGV